MQAIVITPAYTHARPELEQVIMGAGLLWLPLYEHSDLPRARSLLIELALREKPDRVIFSDADTVPDAASLALLATTDAVTPERAVWGLYPLRDGCRWSVNPEDAEAAPAAIAEGRPFRIQSGGLGFACVHRDSLERLGETLPLIGEPRGFQWRPFCVPFYRSTGAGTAAYYADDGSLCARLRESGTELWCHPAARAAHALTRLVTEPLA